MSSLGTILRKEREKQGRTLKEVSDALNIKQKYLEALEKDTYDDIPGVVFMKGFTRNYGNYLGLNGETLFGNIKERLPLRFPSRMYGLLQYKTCLKSRRKMVRKRINNRANGRKLRLLPALSFVCCLLFGF